jgi:hypothetical protein
MGTDTIALAGALVETGNIDTVYRDLYLERARTLLSPLVSLEDFHHLEQERKGLAELPVAVARALQAENWPLVKELSQRTDAARQAVAEQAERFATARDVYAVTNVVLDPFSHSLEKFSGIAVSALPALRTQIVEQLTALEASDVPWREFYAARRTAFQTRAPVAREPVAGGAGAPASVDSVRQAAAQALKAGDMRQLAKLADLMPTVASGAGGRERDAAVTTGSPPPAGPDLSASWSSDTLTAARQLGLGARHLNPRGDLAALRPYAWSPLADDSQRRNIRAVSLPLVRGRLLLDSDTTTGAPVVLINEAAAQKFFPSGDPIGARMRFWGTSRTIVGVVANERFHGVTAPPPIATYAPLAQAPSASGVLLLRTAQQPSTLSASAERVIHEIDPALAVFAVEPLDLTLARSISQRRFTTALLGGFALLALILAAVGIHGLVSYNVERRRQEIGIRMAVGAGRADVYRLILREGAVVIAGALCAGLAGALLLTRLLRTLLFDVSPADVTALLIVAVVLTAVAFAATLMPARRAASTDPLAALRSE